MKLLRTLFSIREGEGFRASLMFAYIFLIIASLVVLKPVSKSLLLSKFGINQLPIAMMLVAVFSTIIIIIYLKFASKVMLNRLISRTLYASIIALFFFRGLLFIDDQKVWFIYAFYIWVAILGVVWSSQFWLLANYVFDAREAKRLFGFIGAGAISGGIFGGYLANYLAEPIGTKNLLLVCCFFIALCLFILRIVWFKSARLNYRESVLQQKRIKQKDTKGNPFQLILNSKHLTYLAGIVGLSVIVAKIVDYQFSAIAMQSIHQEDQLTAFFGFWLSTISVISLFIQLVFTNKILKTFGVNNSLFFLPAAILIGASAILFQPVLWAAILIKVSDGSFKQSLHKAGKELLILPIPAAIKNKSKQFIDVFVVSLATGVAGLALIVITTVFHLSVQHITILLILLITFWLILNIRIKKEYLNSFRLAIEKRSIDLEEQTVNLDDAAVFQNLTSVLEGNNEKQILYVLNLIENVKNDRFVPNFRLLINHPSSLIKVKTFEIISKYDNVDFVFEAGELIEHKDQEVRIAAMEHLCKHSLNKFDILNRFLHHEDYLLQTSALICAAQESREDDQLNEAIDFKSIIEELIEDRYKRNESDEAKIFIKISIARVIGTAKNPELYSYLHNLLAQEPPEVLDAALFNAGQTKAKEFIQPLIDHLNTKLLRKSAREALANYGEDVIESLHKYLWRVETGKNKKLAMIKVLALIGSQKSVNLLTELLAEKDLQMRYEVIKALNKLKVKFPFLKFDEGKIEREILEEIKNYYRILLELNNQNNLQSKPGKVEQKETELKTAKARRLLVKALEEKVDINLERIFRLLGLHYTPKDMFNAYLGITSRTTILRANAIEFLDNVLDSRLKELIIPIVESKSLEHVMNHLKEQIETEPPETSCYSILLNGNDNWLKVCALYSIAESNEIQCKEHIMPHLKRQEPVVKETEEYALNKLNSIYMN